MAGWLTAALNALNGLPTAGSTLTVPPAVSPPVPDPSAPYNAPLLPPPSQPPSAGTGSTGAAPPPTVSGFPAPLGTAPRDPQFATQGTGFLGNLTSMLTNPLTQAALQGYFHAIAAPSSTTNMGRLGIGGATALNTLNEQEQAQQLGYPALRTETAQRGQLAAQEAMRTQALQAGMRPASQSSIARLDDYINIEQQAVQDPTQQDPIQKQVNAANLMYMQSLREGALDGTIPGSSLMAYLQAHDVAKQQNQMQQALMRYYQGGNLRTVGTYLPGMMAGAGLGPGGGSTGAPGTTGAAPAGTAPPSPPTGATPEVIGLPAGKELWPDLTAELSRFPVAFKANITPGPAQNVRKDSATGKWQYMLAPGSWFELSPEGELSPVSA